MASPLWPPSAPGPEVPSSHASAHRNFAARRSPHRPVQLVLPRCRLPPAPPFVVQTPPRSGLTAIRARAIERPSYTIHARRP
ncbi:hypothetical protein AAHA92_06573 [Salvia divinorum]|uniref:Uncharacterized protein n=1 Tax=Salvia divinorum TaxID=28513 RepID=A0ABD1I8Q0_SALDI